MRPQKYALFGWMKRRTRYFLTWRPLLGPPRVKYAQAIVRKHLSADGKEAVPSPATLALDELGRYLTQIHDELKEEAERQWKCLDALTSRLNALHKLLTDFLANTEKV